MAERQILKEKSYKTVYREGDVVVKQFVPTHPKTNVFNEAYNQTVAEESGVPVASVFGVEPRDGGWAIRMEYVSGKTMQALMQEQPEKADELLERFVDIQLEVESRRTPKIRNTCFKMEEVINDLPTIDASTRYELLHRIHGMKHHTKLCHGDFVPANVIIREDGSYCILDWAHATSGNAGADAAITYLRMTLDYPEIADKYLRLYSRKANMPIQYIQLWMPVIAAAQMAKNIQGEHSLLERWVSVAEYQ